MTKEFFNELHQWRIDRNNLIHDFFNKPYSNEHKEKEAKRGYELVKVLNNKSTLVNTYSDKNIKSLLQN